LDVSLSVDNLTSVGISDFYIPDFPGLPGKTKTLRLMPFHASAEFTLLLPDLFIKP
jgi:hypothetical protein